MASDERDLAYAYRTDDFEREAFRLNRAGDKMRRATVEWLLASGVRPGWSVLDVGCGSGSLTGVVAEVVGPRGRVTAIDRDPNMVIAARTGLSDFSNVTVEEGDFAAPRFADGEFDAVVGRLTLMYQPDPVRAVEAVARVVRSGGVVAFMEPDNPAIGERQAGREMSWWPPNPLGERAGHWTMTGIMANGTHPHMGVRLPAVFAEAGLRPGEEPTAAAFVSNPRADVIAANIRGLVPTLVANGYATEDEIGIDTLEERLRAEILPHTLCAVAVMVGCYAVKP